jgi:peptide chain release factor 3
MEKYKQFNKGLEQLMEEGVVQVLYINGQREPILGAVGDLQFEVVVSRLAAEYNVETSIERSSYTEARWVSGTEADISNMYISFQSQRTLDQYKRTVILFLTSWDMKYCIEKNPKLKFSTISEAGIAS